MTPEERRSFLLSMTLTELALILFFLLLLLSVFQLRRKDEAIRQLTRHDNPRLASVLPDFIEWVQDNPDEDFVKLVRATEAADARQRELERRISELEAHNERLGSQAVEAAENLTDLERARDNLGGQLKSCQRQSKGGYGPPPCWADPATGKAEYIYRVVVRENDLEVQPRWPEHREAELDRIPGARELIGTYSSMNDFRNRAKPVLDWSKRQDPECRHYVLIADEAESKDGYKTKRLIVEDYFYKYEQRGTL